MDGVHDLGGMHGLGPIEVEADEPVFHTQWEARTFGLAMSCSPGSTDEFRHAIERMDPADYLASGYYEHWLSGLERLLVEKGVIAGEELDSWRARMAAGESDVPTTTNPERAAGLARALRRPGTGRRPPVRGRFHVGDRVRVANSHPAGHTRCPGYLRRAEGLVERIDGAFSLPDTRARGGPEVVEPVYSVAFALTELWGPDADPRGRVSVDLWESYLEAV